MAGSAQARLLAVTAFNICVSIALVSANRALFQFYGFSAGALLTVLHFAACAVALHICRLLGVFAAKPVPLSSLVTLSVAHAGFVTLNNVNLRVNSVSFYQVSKVLTIPIVVAIQYFVYKRTFSARTLASLAVTTTGIAIATVSDPIHVGWLGLALALSGELLKAVSQILTQIKQEELGVSATQLLYYQTPLSCMLLAPSVPFFDDLFAEGGFFAAWPSASLVGALALSTTLAFAFNLSNYFLLRGSAVTYNMIGNFKSVCVITIGHVVFGQPLSLVNLAGIALALAGVAWYSQIKASESAQAPSKKSD